MFLFYRLESRIQSEPILKRAYSKWQTSLGYYRREILRSTRWWPLQFPFLFFHCYVRKQSFQCRRENTTDTPVLRFHNSTESQSFSPHTLWVERLFRACAFVVSKLMRRIEASTWGITLSVWLHSLWAVLYVLYSLLTDAFSSASSAKTLESEGNESGMSSPTLLTDSQASGWVFTSAA